MSSLENALKIISLLGADRPVLRVGEVCRELDLPKSSVSRLLKTLTEYEIVERVPGDTSYSVGRRALVLADVYTAQHHLLALVDTTLDALTADFQFACYAAVLVGSDIVIVRVKHGTYPLRLVQEIGVPLPAYPTSVGRALLARKSDQEIITLVRQRDTDALSDADILAPIKEIRAEGVAMTTSSIIPGVAALGVAVEDTNRNEMMGFSISYPCAATNAAVHARMRARLREEAQAMGSRVRDPYWLSQQPPP